MSVIRKRTRSQSRLSTVAPRSRAAALETQRRLEAAVSGVRIEPLEERRLLSVTVTGSVTLDESAGLQNSGVAVTGEDNNDNDVAASTLPAGLSTRLFGAGGLGFSSTFATTNGVAQSAATFVQVTGSGTVTSLGFTKADGTALPVLGGADPGVASGISALNGGGVSLFADSAVGNRLVVGVDTNGDRVLALFLEPNATLTSGRVWLVQSEALANPVTTNPDDPLTLSGLGVGAGKSLQFNFNNLPSGQNLFGTVGDTANALVVIGKTPVLNADGTFTNASNTINTSQGGGAVTIGIDNQMFDPGDGAYFTYVKSPDPRYLAGAPGGLDQNEADDADNILYAGGTLAATGASTTISQTQGNAAASMKITAYDVGDSPQGTAFVTGPDGLGTGTKPTITAVKVNGVAVAFTVDGSGVIVGGLHAGDTIAWTTSAPHDRVLIEAVAGKFDIGAFGVNQAVAEVSPLTGIRYEDDGPSITGTATGAPTLTVDETVLATNATGAFAPQFTPAFGTDGQAAAAPVTYALSTPGGNSGLIDTATGQQVNLSLVGGVVQGRTAVSNDLVFTVSVDGSANVTLDQLRAVVHPDATNPDDSRTLLAANLVVLNATATDKDGDSASTGINIGQLLVIKDDGPSITATVTGAPTLTVDETVLATNDTKAFAGQFTPTFGADGPGATPVSYALSTPGGASGLTDTATGQSVVLSLSGGQVLGKTAVSGATVFVVSVDASGNVTLDQQRAVVHANPNDPDESRGLTGTNLVVLTGTATDGDADHASAPLDLTPLLVFKDDGPSIGDIASSIVDFASGSTVTKTLNGAVGADGNATPYTIDSFTGGVTVNGVPLQGVKSGNGTVVTYYADTSGDGTFGNTGDTAYYKLELSQTANSGAGSYTFTVLVDPPPANVSFNFEDLPSGQNLFGMLGDPTTGLIVFGKAPVIHADGTYTNASNTINTSKGGGGTTIGVDNQMFDPGEGAYFTFVKNPDPNFLGVALDANEADDADNMLYTGGTLEVDNGFLKVVQTQGGGTQTMKLSAFNITDSPQGRNLFTATRAPVNITEVKRNGVVVFTGSAASVSVNIAAGDTISWKTNGLHDQVLVEGVAGKWDIGGFGTTQGAPTPDQVLHFVAKVTDGDGDSATDDFSIGIDGTGVNDDGQVSGVTVATLASLFSTQRIDGQDALAALLA